MTPPAAAQPPRNLSLWLLDNSGSEDALAEQAITQPLQRARSPLLSQLSQIGRASIARQVVSRLKELVPPDLVDVFRSAWHDYDALRKAGAASAQHPQSERVVRLRDHKVSFDQKPTLHIDVDGTPFLELVSQLEVVFTLCTPEAVVRAGQLTVVRAGRTTLTGSAKVEDVEIAQRDYVWPHEFVIGFDPGINLVAPEPAWVTGRQ